MNLTEFIRHLTHIASLPNVDPDETDVDHVTPQKWLTSNRDLYQSATIAYDVDSDGGISLAIRPPE